MKRAALEGGIDTHKALLAPIRRVPPEILEEIFLACLPTTHNALIDPREAPLLLGHICSHWRTLSHSTPRLWNSLHIPSAASSSQEQKLETFVEAWLDRSVNCPLSVSLTRNSPRSRTPGSVDERIMAVSHRLRHLSLHLPVPDLKAFAFLGAEELPLLQSVNIFSPPSLLRRDTSEFWTRSPLIQLPRLQHVSLLIQTDALTLPLRWSHLTDLCLGSGYSNKLDQNGTLKILQRCPNLIRCCLHAKKAGTFVSGQSATLLYLEVLILAGLEEPDQLIRSLIIPHLHYLGIRGDVEATRCISWIFPRTR